MVKPEEVDAGTHLHIISNRDFEKCNILAKIFQKMQQCKGKKYELS